jgi:hypothetical protein
VIGSPETSVLNQLLPCNNPVGEIIQFNRGGRLRSWKVSCPYLAYNPGSPSFWPSHDAHWAIPSPNVRCILSLKLFSYMWQHKDCGSRVIGKACKRSSCCFYAGLVAFVYYAGCCCFFTRSPRWPKCPSPSDWRTAAVAHGWLTQFRTLMNSVQPSPLFDAEPSRLSVNK